MSEYSSEYSDDIGALSGGILDQTRSEDWARYTPRTSEVRRRGAALRRRRHVATPVGVVGLATVLAGGVVSMTGGLGNSGGAPSSPVGAAAASGASSSDTPTPSATSSVPNIPIPNADDVQKMLEGAVQIGSGTLGDHAWTVKVAVFASSADLKKVMPAVLQGDFSSILPASGPVWVRANYDHGIQGGVGVMVLPAQPSAIATGKPAVVDPWYAADQGVVTTVVDPRVDHYAVTSGGTTTTYHTVEVKGFRFITFPVTGPGDVTRIVAYDAAGTVLDQGAGHYLPYGVYPYQLPPTDPRKSVGAWG
ncbi:hypothetical protein KGQ20_11720 [Catenulispora sp. NF23]|uniref:hypothetical protein n=1 Tax=Catenulispora pinistramenti TaxID=2705254 RepID=UPI001BA70662|nr:hypothetical protein [Catenulispora pinistramenti]MBS2533440.1 hypothetical protein [Catenulispora pinistramenti]